MRFVFFCHNVWDLEVFCEGNRRGDEEEKSVEILDRVKQLQKDPEKEKSVVVLLLCYFLIFFLQRNPIS